MVQNKNKPPACSPHQPASTEDFPPLSKDPNDNEIMYKRFLTIKHTDPNIKMSDLNPFEVGRKLKTVLGKNHTCKINKIRSGLLLIEVDRKPIVDKLLKTKKIDDIPVIIEEHKALNSSQGMVYCDNVEIKKMTNEQIQAEMENQNVTKVHRIQKRNGDRHEPTNLLIITFGKPLLPKYVKIGYLNVDVRTYIPNPRRCFNCQRYGHGNVTCTHDTVCPTCGQLGHEYGADDCDKVKKCYHCESETHDATSRDCPMYKLEKLILEKKILTYVDFKEARRIVYHENPDLTSKIPRLNKNNSKSTYSDVTAQSSVSAEILKRFAAQQVKIEEQQEIIQTLTEKVQTLLSASSQSSTMDITESQRVINAPKRSSLRKYDDDSSEDRSYKSRRVSFENSAPTRQGVSNMSDTIMPLPSDQGASSNRREEISTPDPSSPADPSVSVEMSENLFVSSGDKEIPSSSSTQVDQESSPEDDRLLVGLDPPVDDKSKGIRGKDKKTPAKNVVKITPPKGGVTKHQHSKTIQEKFKHVTSKISFNR